MENSTKKITSFRLSKECRDSLAELAERYGMTRTAVLELLVKDRKEGCKEQSE